jgi:hypothetical protein
MAAIADVLCTKITYKLQYMWINLPMNSTVTVRTYPQIFRGGALLQAPVVSKLSLKPGVLPPPLPSLLAHSASPAEPVAVPQDGCSSIPNLKSQFQLNARLH